MKIAAWMALICVVTVPALLVVFVFGNDLSPGFGLGDRALIALAAMIGIVVSTRKEVENSESKIEFRTVVGWLVVALLLLLIAVLTRSLLYFYWTPDFDAKDFSPEFNTVRKAFWYESKKPQAWIRFFMLGELLGAYAAYARGIYFYLRALFPSSRWLFRWI